MIYGDFGDAQYYTGENGVGTARELLKYLLNNGRINQCEP